MLGNRVGCLGESLVMTLDGYRHLENIGKYEYVQTITGSFRPVLDISRESYEDAIFLKGYGLQSITLADNTEMLTKKDDFSLSKWTKAKDITPNLFIAIPMNQELCNSMSLTSSECFLLGAYISNGRILHGDRQVVFHIKKSRSFYFTTAACDHIVTMESSTKNYNDYYITDERFINLVKSIDRECEFRQVPKFIMDLDKSLLKEFLRGFLCNMQTYTYDCLENKNIEFSVRSRKLALDMQNIFVKIYNRVPLFSLNVKEGFPFLYSCKLNRFPRYKEYFVADGNLFVKLKEVKRVEINRYFYGLDLEEHPYSVQNIIIR